MAISISLAEVKRKCMIPAGDTSHDSSIDALIAEMQPGIEYGIDDVYLNDSENAKLQAAIKLGILEIISGEFLQQVMREPGASGSISIGGISIGEPAQNGPKLVAQGVERLKPFLKQTIASGEVSQMLSTTSDSGRTFTGDKMKGW